ncbi:phage tail protein [Proteus faecis]|uniref:phage tail protein n=2 Tax=Proteus faecis TaxID=2050967 RepID=UPI00301E3B1A
MKNPKLISKPFAQNGQKNIIPEKYETSMESNQATWDQGFGQITMLPVSAGGLPPKGQDFNGILNQMCETIVHISKGGVFKFSADYATAINGYPKGAILQSEDEKKYYQSLIDNNKVNFNTANQDQVKASWKLVMTDDLLDQLSKKLESSAVAQSTGTSTTSVMSQKASTDAFQPKGTYPTTSEMNIELNKKVDKASISQQLANDVNKVPSLDLVTKELGKKQPAGNYQPRGNYADKESPSNQVFAGKVIGSDEVIAKYGLISLAIKTSNGYPEIASSIDSHNYYSIKLPNSSGSMALRGDSYTKSESDDKYQPIGHYASAGASYTKAESDGRYQKIGFYANKESEQNQVFNSKLIAKNEVAVSSNEISLAIKTANNYPEIVSSLNLKDYFSMKLQNKSGTVALLSDIDEANNIPVGSPIPWSLSSAPTGYLICQGQTFNKSTYPKLAIAYPSGRLPELRSEFIRGADAGRGIDTGREVLSSQSGNSLLSARGMGGNSEFSLKMTSGSVGTDNQGQREIYQQIEGQNGNETRPRNIAFLYIVRAA